MKIFEFVSVVRVLFATSQTEKPKAYMSSTNNKQKNKQTTNNQASAIFFIKPSLWWASSSPLPKQRVRRRTCRQLWTTRSWTCSKSHPTPATSCLNYLNMFLLSVYHHFIVIIVSHLRSHVPPCADSSVWGDVNLVCLTVEPGESESMWKWKYVKVKWSQSHWSRTGWKWKRDSNMWKWKKAPDSKAKVCNCTTAVSFH